MGLFRSHEQHTVEQIQAKLDAARQELAEAEQRLREKALAVALSPDPRAANRPYEALRRARERVELLEAALAQAKQLEVQRKAEARAALRASQDRAIRQHLTKLLKAARYYEAAVKNMISSFDEMCEAGAAIKQLLPADGSFHGFAASVSYPSLKRDAERELNRQGCQDPTHLNSRPAAPGTRYSMGFQRLTTPTLTEDLEPRLLRLFADLTGKSPPPVEPPAPLKALPPPSLPAAPQEPNPSAPPPEVIPHVGDPSSLRSPPPRPQDLAPKPPGAAPEPLRPYPDDPEKQTAFEAELARVRRAPEPTAAETVTEEQGA